VELCFFKIATSLSSPPESLYPEEREGMLVTLNLRKD